MLSEISWADLGRRVRTATPALLAIAGVLMLGRFVVWQQRWGLAVARLDERFSARRRFLALMASVVVNHSTPSVRVFGGIFRARYLARSGTRSFVDHYAAVLFDQIAHHSVVNAVTWLATVGVLWGRGLRWPAAVTAVAGAALAIWLGRRRGGARQSIIARADRGAQRLGDRFAALKASAGELVHVLVRLLASRSLLASAAAWTLGFVVLNLCAQWLLFRALGAEVGLLTVASVVGLGTLAGAVTGSPGGVGTTEAAMTAGFVAVGVDAVDATAATLLYRGMHYALVLALGLPCLAYLELIERPKS